MFFFESDMFNEEGVTLDQVQNMRTFLEGYRSIPDELKAHLDQFMRAFSRKQKEKRQKQKEQALENANVDELQQSLQQKQDDFKNALQGNLQDMKHGMLDMEQKIEAGDAKIDDLKDGIVDNREQTQKASAATKAATKAVKKNKDFLFLIIAVLIFVATMYLYSLKL